MAQESPNSGFWNNRTEALNLLNPLIALNAPSRDALARLSTIESFKGPGDAEVAATFLRAAAKHMPAGNSEDSVGLVNPVAEVRFARVKKKKEFEHDSASNHCHFDFQFELVLQFVLLEAHTRFFYALYHNTIIYLLFHLQLNDCSLWEEQLRAVSHVLLSPNLEFCCRLQVYMTTRFRHGRLNFCSVPCWQDNIDTLKELSERIGPAKDRALNRFYDISTCGAWCTLAATTFKWQSDVSGRFYQCRLMLFPSLQLMHGKRWCSSNASFCKILCHISP